MCGSRGGLHSKQKVGNTKIFKLPFAKIKKTMEVDFIELQRTLQRLNSVENSFIFQGSKSAKNLSPLDLTLCSPK
jgi:hypothetical protein